MTADRTIRIGIIGAGFARTTQIPGFKACAGAKIVAIASAHRERAAEVRASSQSTTSKMIGARSSLGMISISLVSSRPW